MWKKLRRLWAGLNGVRLLNRSRKKLKLGAFGAVLAVPSEADAAKAKREAMEILNALESLLPSLVQMGIEPTWTPPVISTLRRWMLSKATEKLATPPRVTTIGAKSNPNEWKQGRGPWWMFWRNFPKAHKSGFFLHWFTFGLFPSGMMFFVIRWLKAIGLKINLAKSKKKPRRKMTQKNQRDVLCIFGAAGMGKTRYVQRRMNEWTRAIIVEGGFSGENEYPGVKVETWRDFEGYLESHIDSLFRLRFVPSVPEFSLVCDWAGIVGSCALIIDEADRFLSNRVLEPEFIELVNRGRHFGAIAGRGVSLVCISANPFDFPIAFRRQITKAIIFNTAEPNDVEWLAKLFGSGQREWAEKCALLQPGEYVEWVRGEGCKMGAL
jgi:hypothetical protein